MNKLIFNALITSAVLFFMNSCSNNKSMEFETEDFTKTIQSSYAKDTSNGHCLVDIQFLYPVKFGKSEILKKVQQQILSYAFDSTYANYTGKQAVDSFAARTFDDYNFFIEDAYKRGGNENNPLVLHNEKWQMNTIILYNDNAILSYELDRYSEAGGAHGSESTQFMVFDLKTGKKLTERDIFEEGFEPKLADLLKKQIMFDNGFETMDQMLNNGYFMAENIVPNGNFSISEEGITYTYNPIEIGANSLGETEVTIPFAKIKNVLKKESPIKAILEKR